MSFCCFHFFQKTNKKNSTWGINSTVCWIFSFVFFEELKAPKGHFELNWPLQDRRIVKYEMWFFIVKMIWKNISRSCFVLFILLGPFFERTISIGSNIPLRISKLQFSISKSQFVDPIRIEMSELRKSNLYTFWQDLKFCNCFCYIRLFLPSLFIKTIKKYLGIKSVLCKECKHFT